MYTTCATLLHLLPSRYVERTPIIAPPWFTQCIYVFVDLLSLFVILVFNRHLLSSSHEIREIVPHKLVLTIFAFRNLAGFHADRNPGMTMRSFVGPISITPRMFHRSRHHDGRNSPSNVDTVRAQLRTNESFSNLFLRQHGVGKYVFQIRGFRHLPLLAVSNRLGAQRSACRQDIHSHP